MAQIDEERQLFDLMSLIRERLILGNFERFLKEHCDDGKRVNECLKRLIDADQEPRVRRMAIDFVFDKKWLKVIAERNTSVEAREYAKVRMKSWG